MLKIYLTRHGQDEDNELGILNGRRDKPLTQLGLNQARQLALFINNQGLNFNKIYCSPLIRTISTANEITKILNLPSPEILPQLIEREFGIMTGKKISDIEKLGAANILKSDTVTYFLKVEGAETFPQLFIRAQAVLKIIKTYHQDESILLVGHGEFGKMIYAAYYNLKWQEVLKMFNFGNSELIILAEDIKPSETKVFETKQYNS